MRKLLAVLVTTLLILSCSSESPLLGTLYLNFVYAEDGSTTLFPGSDSRTYLLNFNEEEVELTGTNYVIEDVPYGTYDLTCTATDSADSVCGSLETEVVVDSKKVTVNLSLLYIQPVETQEYPEVTTGGITSGGTLPSGGTKFSYNSAIFRFKYLNDMVDIEFRDETDASNEIAIEINSTVYFGSTDFLNDCDYEVDMIWLDSSDIEREDLVFSGTVSSSTWGETFTNTPTYLIKEDDDEYIIGLKSIRISMPDGHQLVDWTNALINP